MYEYNDHNAQERAKFLSKDMVMIVFSNVELDASVYMGRACRMCDMYCLTVRLIDMCVGHRSRVQGDMLLQNTSRSSVTCITSLSGALCCAMDTEAMYQHNRQCVPATGHYTRVRGDDQHEEASC